MNSKKHSMALTILLGATLACLWLLALPVQSVLADTFTVDTNFDGDDGNCYDGDCSLREAINTAAPGDTIVFDPSLSGQTILLTMGQLDIDQNLTIDGADLATHIQISGDETFRVFGVHPGVTVSLIALDIAGGRADDSNGYDGAGIYNEGDLTLVNCLVYSNAATGNGGGIFNTGNLTINNTIIESNTGAYGGGLRNLSSVSTFESHFNYNTALWGGGIDNYAGGMQVESSTFTGNAAVQNGGGVTSSTDLTVINSTFEDNTAISGGGIENHSNATLTVDSSYFTGNSATANVAGLINLEGVVWITNSHFEGNTADYGAGIYNQNDGVQAYLSIVDTTFTDNDAVHEGGGINNRAELILTDCTFTSNSAYNEGDGFGGGIYNIGDLTVNGGAFNENYAHINGGAIDNWGGSLTITTTTFISNIAITGGAIDNNMYSNSTVTGATLRGNSSQNGGGIYDDNDAILSVIDSSFYNNTAMNGGDGIYNIRATLGVTNTRFEGNWSSYGGGIRNDDEATVTLGIFIDNTADFGGGIHNAQEGALLDVSATTFDANEASFNGGGINNLGNLTVSGSTFMGNTATMGGGVYNYATTHLENSTFYANYATIFGGGVSSETGSLSLTNCTLHDNAAVYEGGGLYNVGDLMFYNNIIANSTLGGDCINFGNIQDNVHNMVEDGLCYPEFYEDPSLDECDMYGGVTYTCALLPSSPAIDAGDAATCRTIDQRGETRDDWRCDIGAYELKLADSPWVSKNITEPGEYTFGPTRAKIVVTSLGSLEDLFVERIPGDHPGRTGSAGGNGVGWGEYYDIEPNPGANNFEVDLSLPTLFTPDAEDTLCRYIGGTTWDCAADGYSATPFNHIVRQDVSAFSDWAAGNHVGPTVVEMVSLKAASVRLGGLLPVMGLAAGCLAALIWLLFRRRSSQAS